ncbi:quaternary ammonium compound-resistance protein SugE [Paenibacillus taihuensis]|uniref:Quaternary ammonium compound-resistance protein SugE n=1 Tax=Paenibacillus taihuensis TaxID=1156355 RepID=A0A3D9SGM1_9BACL|nr:multidrug efflux SMR transporter [Paenibacillus taihuensis]REE91405.1 quaternary ammonium compound-resistance protein SugE [Paenibacillus taihuensis]
MAWLFLLIAGLLEICWAYGLQASHGFTRLVPSIITVALLIISFMFFSTAMRKIEIGTAYAVFTGIGTVGTVISGIVLLGEPVDVLKLVFIALLMSGIIGLKMIASDPAEAEAEIEAGGAKGGGS